MEEVWFTLKWLSCYMSSTIFIGPGKYCSAERRNIQIGKTLFVHHYLTSSCKKFKRLPCFLNQALHIKYSHDLVLIWRRSSGRRITYSGLHRLWSNLQMEYALQELQLLHLLQNPKRNHTFLLLLVNFSMNKLYNLLIPCYFLYIYICEIMNCCKYSK